MTQSIVSRKFNVLLDGYLEVSNYYHSELQRHMLDIKGVPSRLSQLIDNLENTHFNKSKRLETILETEAKGQNIALTPDTIAVLEQYCEDILERLEKADSDLVPRNFNGLKNWLSRDVLDIAASFPSFTLAWDKLVELSRLTLVPDPRFLRVRDNMYMATVEFQKYLFSLYGLYKGTSTIGFLESDRMNYTPETIINKLKSDILEKIDVEFENRLHTVMELLKSPDKSIGESLHIHSHSTIIDDAILDLDTMSMVGLELGFTRWLDIDRSTVHKKNVVKSLIYFSKILLAEGSWRTAEEFTTFAIALTEEANRRCKVPENDGTAMFKLNRFWARYRLGTPINEDLEDWNMDDLHPRYHFLRHVLLREFADAIRVLKPILADPKKGVFGNISIDEIDEWPILMDFKDSIAFKDFRSTL